MQNKKYLLVMTVLLVLLIIISISSLFIGRYTLSFSDMLRELGLC